MNVSRSNPLVVVLLFVTVVAAVVFFGSVRSSAFHKLSAEPEFAVEQKSLP
jgi:hypothetical protein